jgi:hypothetical protein
VCRRWGWWWQQTEVVAAAAAAPAAVLHAGEGGRCSMLACGGRWRGCGLGLAMGLGAATLGLHGRPETFQRRVKASRHRHPRATAN